MPSYNIADVKKRLSELVGRVAFGHETFLITRRGRPMAKLVVADEHESAPHLADVEGWLEEDDSFFSDIDGIADNRSKHRPRAVPGRKPRRAG